MSSLLQILVLLFLTSTTAKRPVPEHVRGQRILIPKPRISGTDARIDTPLMVPCLKVTKKTTPVYAPHTFLKKAYLMLESKNENELSSPEDDRPQTVEGFYPIEISKLRGGVAFSLIFFSGAGFGRHNYTELKLYTHVKEWKGDVKLKLTLTNGIRVRNVIHKVDSDQHLDPIVIDVSKAFRPFGQDGCPTVSVTVRLFALHDGREMRRLNAYRHFRFLPATHGPLLVEYLNLSPESMNRKISSSLAAERRNKTRKVRSVEENGCSVRQYSFKMEDIGWEPSFLFYPHEFKLNYCDGTCSPPPATTGMNFYALMKYLYLQRTKKLSSLKPLTCVPNGYSKCSFLYHIPEEYSTYVKNLANAIVKSCQCL